MCTFFLLFLYIAAAVRAMNKCYMKKRMRARQAFEHCPYVSIKLFSLAKRSLCTKELCRGLNACVGVTHCMCECVLLLFLCLQEHYNIKFMLVIYMLLRFNSRNA